MSSQQPSVPPAFVCAITTEVMNDPVTDRDGHSYERAAIEQWLAQNGTSPITRNAMTVNDLVPNRALCDAIVEWRAASGEAAPQRPHRVAAGQSPAATVPMPPASSATTTTAAPVAVTLSVAPSQAVGEPAAANHQQAVMLTVTPPERRHQDNSGSTGGADRLPCDLICVLDTSGSMDDETFAKDADGSTEETGLSILDVVKHSVMTIAQMLGPKDRLAIVNFANNATSRPFVNMDDAGRAEVKTLLDTLKPEGGTNLWTGIQAGMDLARTSSRNCSVFVLTDGRPTSTPPRGYVPTLERALEEFQGPAPFTLSTFGFGYQLDAPLLDGLAKAGNGAFSFIPDGGLVGTVFVNAAANLLATYAQSARAKITLPEGFAPTGESLAAPGVTFDAARGTIVLELGAVQYGQARRHLLHIEASSGEGEGERPRFDPQAISCGVYLRVDGGQQAEVTARAAEACPEIAVEMHTQVGRNAFVRVVPTLTPTTQKELAALVAMLAALKGGATVTTASPLLHALWVDATGEVTLGATNANHGKWGRPYFLSIAAANQRQQCNNFKDKSVQCYGGALFLALQASGEKAFLSLPPPVSTCKKARSSALSFASYTATSTAPRPTSAGAPAASAAASGGKQPKSAAPAKPKKMDWAYNCGGGCIAPQCVVDLAGGEKKPAAAVAKGDVLANGAIVACVVRVKVGGRSGDDEKARRAAQFVALPGGLLVSEYHPVRLSDGEWAFPADVPSRAEAMVAVETTHMFSFLLEEDVESDASAATMRCVSAHGVDVAPFAHRCPSGTPVIGHDFFGSGASRRAIESAKGFADGNVEVTEMLRDAETKRIVGIVTAA